jgi:hypothetical protein
LALKRAAFSVSLSSPSISIWCPEKGLDIAQSPLLIPQLWMASPPGLILLLTLCKSSPPQFSLEDSSSIFLQNVGTHLKFYMAQSRRPSFMQVFMFAPTSAPWFSPCHYNGNVFLHNASLVM